MPELQNGIMDKGWLSDELIDMIYGRSESQCFGLLLLASDGVCAIKRDKKRKNNPVSSSRNTIHPPDERRTRPYLELTTKTLRDRRKAS